jgi:hypothetical protein
LYNNQTALTDYINVPTTVFTPLEYGFVGLSEEDAIKSYGEDDIEVYHSFFQPLEYALTDRDNNKCYGKLVCVKSEGVRNPLILCHSSGFLVFYPRIALSFEVHTPQIMKLLTCIWEQLKSHPGHQVSCLRILIIFLAPSRHILVWYLKLGHTFFLPHLSNLLFINYPMIRH